MTRVLLVRHGQSEWNAEGRWQGQADVALSDLGRLQAVHAAQHLGVVDAIVASDLMRASETALIISEALGVGPVVIEPGFRERDAGEWSGLTRAEIERDWPGYLGPAPDRHSAFAPTVGTPDHEQKRPPSWEPDEDLVVRAEAALVRVHELVPEGEVLVVTHGGLIYAIERTLGAPFTRMGNLEARWIDLDAEGRPKALGDRVVLVDPDEVTIPDQI